MWWFTGERLRDFYVGVTDDAPTAVVPRPFPNPTYQVCYHYTGLQFDVATRDQIICNRVLSGRYVIVQLAFVEYLTLCEVEVYAGKQTLCSKGCSRNYPQGGGGPQTFFCPVGGGCFVDNVSEG